MTIRDYYRSLLQLVMTSTVVMSHWIEFDEQDVYAIYIKGSLDLIDSSQRFVAQYVRIEGAGRDQIFRTSVLCPTIFQRPDIVLDTFAKKSVLKN
jgi:hypothetical protein